MLGAIFERFVEESPVSVMMRGLMERVFAPEQINRIFEENAKIQYTRELLFSSLIELMSLVVCGIHPSANAAYRAKAQQLNVSRTAVYDKLNGVESGVSAAIVTETGIPMASLIEFVGGKSPQWNVENLFFTVTENYECEIQTLGYPKAALFSFCHDDSFIQHFGNCPSRSG
ncbi:MAG: hypothetical protein V7L23_28460 [Nostoc sp.]|uniref:hypothetical protein n=1 Tax=Nostoc sp. TaxID=1180 RepID=UPI002FEEFF3D